MASATDKKSSDPTLAQSLTAGQKEGTSGRKTRKEQLGKAYKLGLLVIVALGLIKFGYDIFTPSTRGGGPSITAPGGAMQYRILEQGDTVYVPQSQTFGQIYLLRLGRCAFWTSPDTNMQVGRHTRPTAPEKEWVDQPGDHIRWKTTTVGGGYATINYRNLTPDGKCPPP